MILIFSIANPRFRRAALRTSSALELDSAFALFLPPAAAAFASSASASRSISRSTRSIVRLFAKSTAAWTSNVAAGFADVCAADAGGSPPTSGGLEASDAERPHPA